MLCLSNRCQIVDPSEVHPVRNLDCGPGQGCESGRCTALFEGTRCDSDTQCGFLSVVMTVDCVITWNGDECTSDENCGTECDVNPRLHW